MPHFLKQFSFFCIIFSVICISLPVSALKKQRIEFLYFSHQKEPPPSLSNLDQPPENLGISGGQLGISDNNTSGQFLNQQFILDAVVLKEDDNPVVEFQKIFTKKKYRYVILNVSAKTLLKLSDLPESKQTIFFNAGAKDNALRITECRKNVFHTVPSYAMLSDALAQFLMTKGWNKWMLIEGKRSDDKQFSRSVVNSAKKFGAKIIEKKIWNFGPDMRRSAQSTVPVFTQGIEVDIIVVADVIGEFGEYLLYRTWSPNLIAGTQGLITTSWHWTQERWGAAQLQSRFVKKFKRKMMELDYSVWQGIRSIGEGATRTNSINFEKIKAYLVSDKFSLAGFKGLKLTFRDWNRQLRQPVLLVTPTALVSASPQIKYLHQRTALDTLGYDKPNSKCR